MILLICILLIAFIALRFYLDADFLVLLYDKYHPNKKEFYEKKTIWITGASSGIGRAIAYDLATINCKLILSGTNIENLNITKSTCLELSQGRLRDEDVYLLPFNMSDEEEVKNAASKACTKYDHIDVLVNNAGIFLGGFAAEIPSDSFKKLFLINFTNHIILSQLIVQNWTEKGQEGHILVNSSLSTYLRFPYNAPYSSSKTALHAFYNIWRLEMSGKPIHFTLACPGLVSTEIVKRPFSNGLSFKEGNDKLALTSERCAHLMLVACANKITETWIGKEPQRIVSFFSNYFAAEFRFLGPFFFNKWTNPKVFSSMYKTT